MTDEQNTGATPSDAHELQMALLGDRTSVTEPPVGGVRGTEFSGATGPENTDAAITDPGFYAPPAVEAHHRPGDVLRLRPTPTPGLPYAGPAWQVLYCSRDTYGEPIVVSGTVIASAVTEDATAPVVVYAPSFHGLGGDCAPSQRLAAGDEPDVEQISAALARGWHVAVVDGEGLGVEGVGPHTFLAGRVAGQVMLDLGRAAARIPALNTAPAPLALWGYADGGRAAVWAGALHPAYAPELDLRGICAGAVVTDPGPILALADQGPWPMLALAGLIGLARAYQHLPLRHVFAEAARPLVAYAEEQSVEALCQRFGHRLATWCDRTVWDDPMWRHVFTCERLDRTVVPIVPVHLYHGTTDAIVPVESGLELARDYQARGVPVSWIDYPADHFTTRTEAIEDVIAHLTGQLTTAPSNSH
ncbi:lipase family protein [Nocardia jiangxiensis]|uniref:lipase family protein n=1 Tax=Nocardia jiangxiensis TaxID=282685 RepID=UPI0002E0BFC9|nr:lipase family protein [Nocardia jiangxiensis]